MTHLLVTAALFFAISARPVLTGFAFAASTYLDVSFFKLTKKTYFQCNPGLSGAPVSGVGSASAS